MKITIVGPDGRRYATDQSMLHILTEYWLESHRKFAEAFWIGVRYRRIERMIR